MLVITILHRVAFANALRGIAALAVIVGHYFGVFWTWPTAIFELTGMLCAWIAGSSLRATRQHPTHQLGRVRRRGLLYN